MTASELPPASPTLDSTVLRQLADDLDDAEFVAVFAGSYRRMLPGRVLRITTSLEAGDVDCALDATLSLKVACLTVGARQLAELASVIERDVRRHDVVAARAAATHLPAVAGRTDHMLADYLGP